MKRATRVELPARAEPAPQYDHADTPSTLTAFAASAELYWLALAEGYDP